MVDMLAVAGWTFQRVIMVDEYRYLRDVHFENKHKLSTLYSNDVSDGIILSR